MGAAKKFPPLVVNDDVVQYIIECTKIVFETTFGIETTVRKKDIISSPKASGDISGIVGICQDSLEGNLILSFPQESLFFTLSKVYQDDIKELNKSARDATGELTNMIYGQFKHRLNELGYSLQMALPNIILSNNHEIFQTTSCGGCTIEFELDKKYKFHVTLALQGE